MTLTKDRIPVNIWDDYYDDESVPKGEKQETYAYVEEYDGVFNESMKVEIIKYLHDYVSGLNLPGVELKIENGTDLAFINFTHKQREELVEKLNGSKLSYKGYPFLFYSES